MTVYTIKNICNDDIPHAKKLWSICFPEDSNEFIDYYFEERTTIENIICAYAEEKPVAMLHIIPHSFKFALDDSRFERIGFIAGVATHPEYRGRGIANKLLGAADAVLKEREIRAAMLSPFRASFYEKAGYEVLSNRRIYEVSKETFRAEHDSKRSLLLKTMLLKTMLSKTISKDEPEYCLNENVKSVLAGIYNDFMIGHLGYAHRDAGFFETLIREYKLENGFMLTNDDCYALGYRDDGKLILNEFAYRSRSKAYSFIAQLLEKFDSIRIPLSEQDTLLEGCMYETEVLNMIKVLDNTLIDDLHVSGFDEWRKMTQHKEYIRYSFELY